MPDNKEEKYSIIQKLVIVSTASMPIWDVFFNESKFNAYHLGIVIVLFVTIFDKFKLDSLGIKIPGLLEIVETNQEINRNIEKL